MTSVFYSIKHWITAHDDDVDTPAVTSALDRAVVAVASNASPALATLATAAATAIEHADATVPAEDGSVMSGDQKKAVAISQLAPIVLSVATGGGFIGALKDAEPFAAQLIESILAKKKQTGALKIAQALLSLVD